MNDQDEPPAAITSRPKRVQGCRWLEAEMLGHANLSQTSTYLHAKEKGLQESMAKFNPALRGNAVATELAIGQPLVATTQRRPRDKTCYTNGLRVFSRP